MGLVGLAPRQYENEMQNHSAQAPLKDPPAGLHGGAARRDLLAAVPLALVVMGTMTPATIVIPVIRSFVSSGWAGADWVFHGFMAFNLLGACVAGPLLAMRAERVSQRRLFAAGLAGLDAAMIGLVALKPPLAVMLTLRAVQGAASVGAVSLLMGAARGGVKSSAGTGLLGSAVVLALLVGIPLGAILGKVDPALPLVVGAVMGGLSGLAALWVFPKETDAQASRLTLAEVWSTQALRLPTLVVGLERFSVGLFTVTLQLFAFHVLQVSDGRVGQWFSVFLMSFAVATVPFTRLGDKLSPTTVISVGALWYAGMFFGLGWAPVELMPLLLALGGVGSAAIYGPCLSLASKAVPPESRASAMGVMNAAGTFGMFAGNVTAGLVSAALLSAGVDRAQASIAVFVIAGASQLISVAWTRSHGAAEVTVARSAASGPADVP